MTMARLRKITQHNSLEEIRATLKKSISGEYKLRLLALEKMVSNPNMATSDIGEMFYITKITLLKWMSWYNEGGLEKLKNGNGGKGTNGGAQTIYDKKMFDTLATAINENQNTVWTLEKMQRFLKETFSLTDDKLPTIQTIRHRMKKEYSYKSSRPYPKQADRDQLGRFKKTVL